MNQHITHPLAQSADARPDYAPDQEAQNMRSLALNMRKHSHRYREWARQSAAQGHRTAAEGFNRSAQRYASDALWYWKRSRRGAVQFNTEDAS